VKDQMKLEVTNCWWKCIQKYRGNILGL